MGRFSWIALALTSLMASTAHAAVTWTATPFNPASVPLAVRTPYLSTWLPQGAGASLAGTWPAFWTGSTLGWAGYVKVDGTTYTFLGAPAVAGTTLATQKSSSVCRLLVIRHRIILPPRSSRPLKASLS
jgi:hypothetical protein